MPTHDKRSSWIKRLFARGTSRQGHSRPQLRDRPDGNSKMGSFINPTSSVRNHASSQPQRMGNWDDVAAREKKCHETIVPEANDAGKLMREALRSNSDSNAPVPRPTPQSTPSSHLENDHKPVLEQIQSLLGIAKRLEDNPQNEELRRRLVSGVLGFSGILEAEGLEVMAANVNPAAFISVVDDVDRPSPLVVRPAILRNGNLLLKGIMCLPKAAPVDAASGEANESVSGGTR